MSVSRKDYFIDVIRDCVNATAEAGVPPDQRSAIIVALLLSDSVNGLRKALLQIYAPRSPYRPE